ncbi:hypothetical protein D3C76_1704460 [compost metagenome]
MLFIHLHLAFVFSGLQINVTAVIAGISAGLMTFDFDNSRYESVQKITVMGHNEQGAGIIS